VNVLIGSGFRHWNAEAAYAARLAALLRSAGHGAWVLAPPETRNAAELSERGLDPITGIHPSNPNPLHWPGELRRLREFQALRRIDVVNVFQAAEWPLHLWAARRGASPEHALALVRTRGGARVERSSWFNRRMYGVWSDAVIASCELIRNRLQANVSVPDDRIRTIYYPADPPTAPNAAERAAKQSALLRELGLEPGRFLLAVVGRIAPEKGHERLVRALAALIRRLPHAALLIVNKAYPSEAPHRERLERLVRELDLEPWVRWLGFRADLRRVMACADLGVIPSLASELNCRVAVEFFSAGTPVVAFPTGALPEVVEHGLSGWVTAKPSPEELEAALFQLAENPELRAALAEGARGQAAARFGESDFLRATLEVFEQALRRRRTERSAAR
jgi:glycosyltransferase involved in cell wall biosynthesis